MARTLSPALRQILPILSLLPPLVETARAVEASPDGSDDLCRPAIAAAEIDAQLPRGLLLAIARVESGRRDRASGTVVPFPWTINAEGVPMVFATRNEAIAAVESLRGRQVRSIDVGCMQINLHHHAQAFTSLAEAFDPGANIRYAASFLIRLREAARGDWDTAIGRYHSSTPGLSDGYRARVRAAWTGTSLASSADVRREQLATAWANAKPAGPHLPEAIPPAAFRPRDRRDPLEQIAVAWGRTRPLQTAVPASAPIGPMVPLGHQAAQRNWAAAASRGLRLTMR